MGSNKKILRVEGVSYKYISESRHNAALTNVTFDVDEGEFVAIIGTNGSGKSTLAKHLNALLLPTTGKVYVDDMDTSVEANLWHIRSTVGMVFQNPDNQIIAALVEDDIAFGPENLGIAPDEIQRRVDLSLNAVNMLDYKNFAPHKLSGGQKQRIAIAGALALQTKCIVLDEPTAMLDPQGRAEVLATVKRLHDKQGLTIVYITHFMDEVALADRVFIMDKGQIVKTGTPKKVFTCVDEIKNLGLDVPIAVEMTYRLRKKGFNLPTNILSADDFASAVINN